MKKLILFIALMLTVVISSAQTFKAPVKQRVDHDSTTTYHYEVKDTTYTVYKSPRGAFYIWKRTRNGNIRKTYLPKEIQIQMGRIYTKED